MANPLFAAMAERDRLQARVNSTLQQIDDWKREIAQITTFIDLYDRFSAMEVEDHDRQVRPGRVMLRKTTGNSDKEDVALHTRVLIEGFGRPIPRPELLELLRGHGLTIDGANAETVLSTMLWRTKDSHRIVHIRNHGYWLMDQPYIEGHYFPEGEAFMQATDDGGADHGDDQ